MQINKLRVLNYKGFKDSGWLQLPKGFTVVVGQNNAGKTALLEAFRLSALPAKPHRNLDRDAGTPLDPVSIVEIELDIPGRELLQCILNYNQQVHVPLAPTASEPNAYLDQLFNQPRVSLDLAARGGSMSAIKYPSIRFAAEKARSRNVVVQANADRLSVNVAAVQNSAHDTVPTVINQSFGRSVYVFKAERLNIGRTKATEASVLAPDGSNLAAVLMNLQSNPRRFQRFKGHVIEIFPNIRELSVNLVDDDCEVRIWSVETERDDLAIPLQESGTGIGQVLAILYVALTISSGLIVIDEPNTFLHPGAAKKLIQIL